jgi:hypothetical protein
MPCSDSYAPPQDSALAPGEWLTCEKTRLARLGLESGQRFIFHFGRDTREDWVENRGRFERPICDPNSQEDTTSPAEKTPPQK